jgi:hypothetical protein
MADLSAYNDLESEFKRLSSGLPTRISTVETHESDAGEALEPPDLSLQFTPHSYGLLLDCR